MKGYAEPVEWHYGSHGIDGGRWVRQEPGHQPLRLVPGLAWGWVQADPPAEVARILALGRGKALVRRRVLYANDEPTQIADSYFPWSLTKDCPALLQENPGRGGSYGRLAEIGLGPVRFTEDVDVRTPTEVEQRVLDLEPSQVVFEIWHVAYAAEDRPVEVCIHVMPSHLWTLRYGWDDPSGTVDR